jgi:ribonucleoside-diphosphate reductase alpha chain
MSYFRNPLAEFVYLRTYSRWLPEKQRRENWEETIDRYMSFMKENLKDKISDKDFFDIREAILHQEIMPSMRLMQFAGDAARRNNVCAYNCSFIKPKTLQDISEIMFLSMSGTGVGFSVEKSSVAQLPRIEYQTKEKVTPYVVPDSREGWSDALAFGLKTWFSGKDVDFDLSELRPAGARLKTTGGKSSGPDPLRDILAFTREKILAKQGDYLSTLDVHDIICKIGEGVVTGGVRRTALISLSDLNDYEIRDAKTGQFWYTNPQRSLANNSAVYDSKPTMTTFMEEWLALMKSGTGERGIFNRGGLNNTLPDRRKEALGGFLGDLGTNPCGEIILQSKQLCNLSEIVARPNDSEQNLLRKARLATILGTYQASLTKWPYLSRKWKENCEKEALLGVSITGQWDCPVVRNSKILQEIKNEVIEVNKRYSKKFGINPSTCTTAVKPSGTVSQTVDCSSGMHTRFSPYYIRRVRISVTDSLFNLLKDQGVPYYPEVGQSEEEATTYVLEFPIKAPATAVFELSAIEQLEHWEMVKTNYTEHNPSVTVTIDEEEWLEVGAWVYKNWNIIGGLSFLPKTKHVYQLAPYEKITRNEYLKRVKQLKNLDFSKITDYEKEDETDVKHELACSGGTCEVN